MSVVPGEVVVPVPNMVDAEFWDHCRARRLMFQSCAGCGELRHPPTPFCASCHSTETAWREAPRVGQVYSYTISYLSKDVGLSDANPYIIAVVEFAGFGPVRLVTNLAAQLDEVRVGLPVELFWEPVSDDMFLPLFKPCAP